MTGNYFTNHKHAIPAAKVLIMTSSEVDMAMGRRVFSNLIPQHQHDAGPALTCWVITRLPHISHRQDSHVLGCTPPLGKPISSCCLYIPSRSINYITRISTIIVAVLNKTQNFFLLPIHLVRENCLKPRIDIFPVPWIQYYIAIDMGNLWKKHINFIGTKQYKPWFFWGVPYPYFQKKKLRLPDARKPSSFLNDALAWSDSLWFHSCVRGRGMALLKLDWPDKHRENRDVSPTMGIFEGMYSQ